MYSLVISSKLIIFCIFCLIILVHLITLFLYTRPLFVPYVYKESIDYILVFNFFTSWVKSLLIAYAYVSIELISSFLLLLLALNAILATSSENKFCFSLLNRCWIFYINLLFFTIFSWFSFRLSISGFSTNPFISGWSRLKW